MQRAIVTGGAGFIGSHLVDYLLAKGFSVIAIDNLSTGSEGNLEHLKGNSNFSFINHDITKPLSIDGQVDQVYHLASPASPNNNNPISYMHLPVETMMANSVGTHLMITLAKEKNAKFLFASTSEIYGNPTVHPQPETYFGNVNSVGVRAVYDESKRFGETMTMTFIRRKEVDGRIVRIFNTYGPRLPDDGRVISNFIRQVLKNQPLTVFGKGEQTRSFCYVSDLVEGLFKAMELKQASGEVINIGNPEEYSIAELSQKILTLSGAQSIIEYKELPSDDPEKRKPDIQKAKNLLSWEPTVSLEEGLAKTLDYFKTH